jgi:hypothetical protein
MEGQPHSNEKHARLGERVPIQCCLVLANGVQVGEGRVFDLSMRGCLVEGAVRVKAGDRLQLRLRLPHSHPSICVSVALVRWVQGRRFGLEFMRVEDTYRAHLDRFITFQSDPWARVYD